MAKLDSLDLCMRFISSSTVGVWHWRNMNWALRHCWKESKHINKSDYQSRRTVEAWKRQMWKTLCKYCFIFAYSCKRTKLKIQWRRFHPHHSAYLHVKPLNFIYWFFIVHRQVLNPFAVWPAACSAEKVKPTIWWCRPVWIQFPPHPTHRPSVPFPSTRRSDCSSTKRPKLIHMLIRSSKNFHSIIPNSIEGKYRNVRQHSRHFYGR